MPPLDADEMDALRTDIAARGILVAIEVDEQGAILDGHHRVQIAWELGITRYPRVVLSGLTEADKMAHAFALNLHRRHLPPVARAAAVVALRTEGWGSTRRIAPTAGVSQSTVVRDLRDQGDSQDSPAQVTGVDGKTYRARRPTAPPSIVVHTPGEQRRAQAALEALGEDVPGRGLDLRRAERLARDKRASARRAEAPVALPSTVRIECCDLRDLHVEPGSVDLIVTDPPYDRPGLESGAWEALGAHAALWLCPGGMLLAYAGQMYLPEAMAALGGSGLGYWWTYAVVHDRSSGSGQVRQRGFASARRPVLVYRQPGGPAVPPFTMDLAQGAGREKEAGHPWQQGAAEIEPWTEALCPPAGVVCDPFLGSGTTALAAVSLGRSFIGCDIDLDHLTTARQRVAQALAEREPEAGTRPQ